MATIVICFPFQGYPSPSVHRNLASASALEAWRGYPQRPTPAALHQMRTLGRWLRHKFSSRTIWDLGILSSSSDSDLAALDELACALRTSCAEDSVMPMQSPFCCSGAVSHRALAAVARQTAELTHSEVCKATAHRTERELQALFSLLHAHAGSCVKSAAASTSADTASRATGCATASSTLSSEDLVSQLLSVLSVRDLWLCESGARFPLAPAQWTAESSGTDTTNAAGSASGSLRSARTRSSSLASDCGGTSDSDCAGPGRATKTVGIDACSSAATNAAAPAVSSLHDSPAEPFNRVSRAPIVFPYTSAAFLSRASEWLIENVLFAPTVLPELRAMGRILLSHAASHLASHAATAKTSVSCFLVADEPAFIAVLAALRLRRPPPNYIGPGALLMLDAGAGASAGTTVSASWCHSAFPFAAYDGDPTTLSVHQERLFADLPLASFLDMLRPPAPGMGTRSGALTRS
jgi:hypothetical protein